MANQLEPVPKYFAGILDQTVNRWMEQLRSFINGIGVFAWTSLDFEGSSLADVEDRSHGLLQDIQDADETSSDITKNRHVSNAQIKTLYDRTGAASETTSGIISLASDVEVQTGTDDTKAVTPAGLSARTATATRTGMVLQAAVVSDAPTSGVEVTSADAATQGGAYVQADVQSIADLSNELKGDVNTLVTDVNNVKAQLNDLMAKLRTSGVLAT